MNKFLKFYFFLLLFSFLIYPTHAQSLKEHEITIPSWAHGNWYFEINKNNFLNIESNTISFWDGTVSKATRIDGNIIYFGNTTIIYKTDYINLLGYGIFINGKWEYFGLLKY